MEQWLCSDKKAWWLCAFAVKFLCLSRNSLWKNRQTPTTERSYKARRRKENNLRLLRLTIAAFLTSILCLAYTLFDRGALHARYLCWRHATTVTNCFSKRPFDFTYAIDGIQYDGNTGNYLDASILHLGAFEKDILYFLRDTMKSAYSGRRIHHPNRMIFGLLPGSVHDVMGAYLQTGEPLIFFQDCSINENRTGAAGAIGAKYLARRDASRVAVLGSALHAETQLKAVAAVRNLTQARIFSPTLSHREAFAEKMSRELGISVYAVASAVIEWTRHPPSPRQGISLISACAAELDFTDEEIEQPSGIDRATSN
jgi:Ornithine cyclodeaminase/mu-crystallin family